MDEVKATLKLMRVESRGWFNFYRVGVFVGESLLHSFCIDENTFKKIFGKETLVK